MTDLRVRCVCGGLTGFAREVEPARVNRVVCHCRGCRAYARVLDRETEILDARGGTDVFQMSPRHLVFDAGMEHLACMRLSDRGALRWYARCCKTPIAHTLPSPRVPFMAINHACIDWPAAGRSRTSLVGPVRARVNGRFSRAEARPLKATKLALLLMVLRYTRLMLGWMVRGDGRHSPFFDARTRAPIIPPQRVDPAYRAGV